MKNIVIGSLVKIFSTDKQLLNQGITPKQFNKRYPKRFALVDHIYKRNIFNNEIRSMSLHKGFYITEDQLEPTGTIVYRGDKAIGELLDKLMEGKELQEKDLSREVMQ